jgi:hypothetical protein
MKRHLTFNSANSAHKIHLSIQFNNNKARTKEPVDIPGPSDGLFIPTV